jgi:hypothetical protein
MCTLQGLALFLIPEFDGFSSQVHVSLDLRHNLSHGRKYTCYKTDGRELSSPYHGCDLRH